MSCKWASRSLSLFFFFPSSFLLGCMKNKNWNSFLSLNKFRRIKTHLGALFSSFCGCVLCLCNFLFVLIICFPLYFLMLCFQCYVFLIVTYIFIFWYKKLMLCFQCYFFFFIITYVFIFWYKKSNHKLVEPFFNLITFFIKTLLLVCD